MRTTWRASTIGIGFLVAFAGLAGASGRARATVGAGSADAGRVAATVLQPQQVPGDTQVWSQDGKVRGEDARRMRQQRREAEGPILVLPDGSKVYADGLVVGPKPEGAAAPPPVVPSLELTLEGHTMTVNLDGSVHGQPSRLPGWVWYRQSHGFTVVDGRRVYDDGKVFANEPRDR
jgi:hypothetical protein